METTTEPATGAAFVTLYERELPDQVRQRGGGFRRSSASGQDLLAQDVGMPCMLRELTYTCSCSAQTEPSPRPSTMASGVSPVKVRGDTSQRLR